MDVMATARRTASSALIARPYLRCDVGHEKSCA